MYASADVDEALEQFGPVRYQLLTGTGGTVTVGKDSVFHVLVFKTSLYNKAKGNDNRRGDETSIERASGKPLPITSEGPCTHEVVLAGKP